MTSEPTPQSTPRPSLAAAGPGTPGRVYVWVWLPGATDPVVAGALSPTGTRIGGDPAFAFAYARSYRQREHAISLFTPDLPLAEGTFDPTRPGHRTLRDPGGRLVEDRLSPWLGHPRAERRSPTALHGCLRDAAPDAWGRRVINLRLAGSPDAELTELTYLLASSSDRIGALDFQTSPTEYVARGEDATLEQLVEAATRIENGQPVPEDLAAAAGHGTSIGGARPKALLRDGDRQLVAKFSSSSDDRPVVKAEAVGMLLAARLGLDVPAVEVVRCGGKDVLLVDRFDRTPQGGRRLMLSALTVLGLREEESRYASYTDLARAIRQPGWAEAERQLRELYTRMVLNIAISNNDDHLRNHATFWDGQALRLTPAYDVAPQRRNTTVATHAIGINDHDHTSQFRVALDAAGHFNLTRREAAGIVEHVKDTITTTWEEVCDQAHLTRTERQQLWGREILNEYASWDQP